MPSSGSGTVRRTEGRRRRVVGAVPGHATRAMIPSSGRARRALPPRAPRPRPARRLAARRVRRRAAAAPPRPSRRRRRHRRGASRSGSASELAKPRLAPDALPGLRARPRSTRAPATRSSGGARDARAPRLGRPRLRASSRPGIAAHQLLAARAAGDAAEGLVDLLVVAEAVALAADLNQVVKYAVGRERPFVHFGNGRRPRPATATTTCPSTRATPRSRSRSPPRRGRSPTLRGYRSAPWVWGVGTGRRRRSSGTSGSPPTGTT